MKLFCSRAELMSAINIVSRATAAKSPIPSLEGILIEAGTGNIRLTGYDLKKGIYTDIPAEVAELGSVVIGARIFGEIVRSLPSDRVSLSVGGNHQVTISSDNAEFSIIGSDFNDYPELPSVDSAEGLSVSKTLLGDMISRTSFAISDNEARPVYTGALFEVEDGYLTVCAVDGYRLAMRKEKLPDCHGEYKFIVPGAALSDLEKLCAGEEDEQVYISLGAKHISFTIGKTVIISRRLEGDFINYRRAVPTEFMSTVTVQRTHLQRAIERVSLIIDAKIKNPLRCTFRDGEINILCATSLGRAEDSCAVEGKVKEVEIGFNNRYLLDALRAAPADTVKINVSTSSSPCVISPADDGDNFRYMILPVRLKAGE